MIGVKGQYQFKFSLGGQSDFLEQGALNEFMVIEECGNILPAWKFSFYTAEEELLQYVNEGNILEVSYGSSEDMIDTKLLICKKDIQKVGQKYLIYCAGIYDCIKYITVPHIRITDKQKGSEAIKKRAEEYFEIDKIDEDEHEQNWIQHNQTDKAFINAVARHAYSEEGFFGVGITSDGKFRFVDINKAANGSSKFKFGKNGIDVTSVKQMSDSGFLNSWSGYGRERLVHNMEEGGKSVKAKEDIESKLAMSGKLNKNEDVSKRYAILGMINANTHEKYQHAKLRNLQGLASYSCEGLELTFMNKFEPIKVFDVCMFKQQSNSGESSSEAQSGLYLTTLVSRVLNKSQLYTHVQMHREASGGQK